jgi:hypothetical protein
MINFALKRIQIMTKTETLKLGQSIEPSFAEISVKGKAIRVPAAQIAGHTIVSNGSWLKIAEIHDEVWQAEQIADPEFVVEKLKQQPIKADIFTFAQKLPDVTPKYKWRVAWDNLAVIPIITFNDWWEKRLPQETRKNVRRSGRRGVITQVISIDDEVAHGLKQIYDETPFRQGRKFWHYGKSVEAVKRENSSYNERSTVIGAYVNNQLIGLLKMVHVGQTASIMQIISQNRHFDKRPANALLAKAVEICEQNRLVHFVYGQYTYGKNYDAPLTEFKRRNGFEQMLVPRYYIPLTLKGKIALRLNLHMGLRHFIPQPFESTILKCRSRFYHKAAKQDSVDTNESGGTSAVARS